MKRYAMILGAVLLVLALSGCGKKFPRDAGETA